MRFKDTIFQHDNAPVNKSMIVGNFFQEKECKILEWPDYSPDINSIEILYWNFANSKRVYEIDNFVVVDVQRSL